MCEFNTKVQSSNFLRLTIVSAKSENPPPRRRYLLPGNSIVLEEENALSFISITTDQQTCLFSCFTQLFYCGKIVIFAIFAKFANFYGPPSLLCALPVNS